MVSLTIFTPTFNRVDTLKNLYNSLLSQINTDFEWIIVDDGSRDNTKKVVEEWIQNSPFPIIYKYKINEGKHIAINEGVKLASGEWFFIVDSDDTLTDDAVEKVLYYCNSISKDKSFAGVVGLRGDSKGRAWEKWHTKNKSIVTEKSKSIKSFETFIDATSIEYRYKYKIEGDRAEVVRTEIMKNFPFPQFEGEKFLVESYLWLQLANSGYKFRWFNSIIYITEYLSDGLTNNIENHYKNSPNGSMEVYNMNLLFQGIPLTVKIKSAYNYCVYGLLARKSYLELYRKINNKLLFPLGIFLAIVRKK